MAEDTREATNGYLRGTLDPFGSGRRPL